VTVVTSDLISLTYLFHPYYTSITSTILSSRLVSLRMSSITLQAASYSLKEHCFLTCDLHLHAQIVFCRHNTLSFCNHCLCL